MSAILDLAHEAGLSPLVTRIATSLSRIGGEEAARAFIEDVRRDGVLRAIRKIEAAGEVESSPKPLLPAL